jgi:hypothetical protein
VESGESSSQDRQPIPTDSLMSQQFEKDEKLAAASSSHFKHKNQIPSLHLGTITGLTDDVSKQI